MVLALKKAGVKTGHHERSPKMKKNWTILCAFLVLTAGLSSCRPYAGLDFYSKSPRFARTHRNHVMLIKQWPRRDYVELGHVWIKIKPWMDRYYVENKLRKKAARKGADAVVITVDGYSRGRVAHRRYRGGTLIYRKTRVGGVAIRFLR